MRPYRRRTTFKLMQTTKKPQPLKLSVLLAQTGTRKKTLKNKDLNCLVSVILILTIDTTTVKPTPPYT